MSRPAERVKPWNEYRPMFITQARIDGGRKFLAEHRAELSKVQADTGVPAQIIVAIIGWKPATAATPANIACWMRCTRWRFVTRAVATQPSSNAKCAANCFPR